MYFWYKHIQRLSQGMPFKLLLIAKAYVGGKERQAIAEKYHYQRHTVQVIIVAQVSIVFLTYPDHANHYRFSQIGSDTLWLPRSKFLLHLDSSIYSYLFVASVFRLSTTFHWEFSTNDKMPKRSEVWHNVYHLPKEANGWISDITHSSLSNDLSPIYPVSVYCCLIISTLYNRKTWIHKIKRWCTNLHPRKSLLYLICTMGYNGVPIIIVIIGRNILSLQMCYCHYTRSVYITFFSNSYHYFHQNLILCSKDMKWTTGGGTIDQDAPIFPIIGAVLLSRTCHWLSTRL